MGDLGYSIFFVETISTDCDIIFIDCDIKFTLAFSPEGTITSYNKVMSYLTIAIHETNSMTIM